MSRTSRLGSILALLATAAFAAVVSILYVRAEHTVYSWDYAVYHDLARRAAAAFARSVGSGVAFTYGTLDQAYNALFALPLVPFLTVFGGSRLTYVLAVTLVYHLPYAMVLGSIAARTVDGPRRTIAWAATAAALLLPGLWLPVLRGYPDSAAALLFALATRAYLEDTTLARAWQPPLIGCALAASALLRRHFLVTAPIFLCSMCVVAFLERRKGGAGTTRAAAETIGRTALAGGAALAFATVAALPFVNLVATRDYYDLYRSYMLPVGDVAYSLMVEPYGALVAAAAVAGFALGARARVMRGAAATFVALEGLAAAAAWSLVVRQGGMQYSFHAAQPVVVGLALLGWSLWRGRGWRSWTLPVLAAALTATFVSSFWSTEADLPEWVETLLPVSAPPRVRDDLHALRALVDDLRNRCGSDQPVFVVASSPTLNSDLLMRAAARFRRPGDPVLDVLPTPEVDTRDKYPVGSLIDAGCVVVATPLQLHLEREEQDLVAATFSMFRSHTGIARDFAAAGRPFELRNGVRVEVYRRTRPTSTATGLETLGLLRAAIPEPSSRQPDWVVVSRSFPAWVSRLEDGATRIVLHPSPPDARAPAVAAYRHRVRGAVQVSGTLKFFDKRCQGVQLTVGPLTPRGPENAANAIFRPGGTEPFAVAVVVPRGRPVGFLVSAPAGQDSIDYCLVSLDVAPVGHDPGGSG